MDGPEASATSADQASGPRRPPDREKGAPVGLRDKAGAAADKAAGAAKDKIGAATDKPDLQAEGQAQNAVGHARQSGHDIEDTAREIVDDE